MKALAARRLAQDSELSEAVEKVAAEAPPLSDTQRDTLRHIFRPNVKSAGTNPTRRPSRTVRESSDASAL
jgi:hypothetical protein